jgi:hypothetical protein
MSATIFTPRGFVLVLIPLGDLAVLERHDVNQRYFGTIARCLDGRLAVDYENHCVLNGNDVSDVEPLEIELVEVGKEPFFP